MHSVHSEIANQINVIQLQDLQRQVGGVGVIRGITAHVQPGDVVALLGKNGAGKTTLLETILGFGLPAYGSASLWGVKAADIGGTIKQRIGFVPQRDELLSGLSGWQHLEMFRSFRTSWNEDLVQKLVIQWLIPMETRVAAMSVAQRQKLSILLAFAHEPELLVLDEPVASLDPIARRQFLQQLIEIASDEQRTIIFSTHIVSDVERVANKVWMLSDGRLHYQGDLDHLKESVVRVSILAEQPLPRSLGLPDTIRSSVQDKRATVSLMDWHPQLKAQLEQQFNAQVEVENLSLEDIFMELGQ